MEPLIKTEEEEQHSFLERVEPKDQNQITAEEIVLAQKAFNQLIEALDSKKANLKLEDLQELYNIEIYHIETLSIQPVKAIYEEIMSRYQSSKARRNWYENELRIFVWILFSFCEARKKPIEKFNNEEWELISAAFVGKTVEDIKFEWLLLIKSTSTTVPWTEEEDELLESLMGQQEYHNKWIDIAKVIYQNSKSENFRKPKQCRERWKNYLNPSIEKGEWTLQEDRRLFEFVKQFGKKWSNISKALETRTEHSVKNRYKSLLKKYKKDNSIRQKAKSTKGLHTKELQQIESIIASLDKRISQKNSANKQPTPKEKEQEEIITRDEMCFQRFYPISPSSAWKYYHKNMPPVLTIIQSPRIISPKLNSPGFRYAIGAWEQETNKLFYS